MRVVTFEIFERLFVRGRQLILVPEADAGRDDAKGRFLLIIESTAVRVREARLSFTLVE